MDARPVLGGQDGGAERIVGVDVDAATLAVAGGLRGVLDAPDDAEQLVVVVPVAHADRRL